MAAKKAQKSSLWRQRYMCTPEANLGNPPREVFLIQLREARTEWRRRKSVNATGGCHSA